MFEPIYHNTAEVTASASGILLDEKELLDSISDCQRLFVRGDPEKELKDKYRYCTYTYVTVLILYTNVVMDILLT